MLVNITSKAAGVCALETGITAVERSGNRVKETLYIHYSFQTLNSLIRQPLLLPFYSPIK